jgi:hypothetical protein
MVAWFRQIEWQARDVAPAVVIEMGRWRDSNRPDGAGRGGLLANGARGATAAEAGGSLALAGVEPLLMCWRRGCRRNRRSDAIRGPFLKSRKSEDSRAPRLRSGHQDRGQQR